MNKLYVFREEAKVDKMLDRLERNLKKTGIEYEKHSYRHGIPEEALYEMLDHAEYGFKDILKRTSTLLKRFPDFTTDEMVKYLTTKPKELKQFLFLGTYKDWFKIVLDGTARDDDYSIFVPRVERGFLRDGTFRTDYFGLRW